MFTSRASRDTHGLQCRIPFHLQGKYDAFTAELSKDGMDANQPDEKGRLPLIEAVKTKDIRFVDALIQFGALANVKDPATGAAPLQFAFTSGLVDVSRQVHLPLSSPL